MHTSIRLVSCCLLCLGIFCVGLLLFPSLQAAEVSPQIGGDEEAAGIARAYLATGDIETLNRIFRIPRAARRPAVSVLLPQLVTTNTTQALERSFTLFRCLDARGPESIAALRPFLAAGQPLQGHALCALDALGNDGEPLIPDLLALLKDGGNFASTALSRIGRKGDMVVPALLAALRGADGTPRIEVIDALGNPAWALQAHHIVPVLTGIIAAPEPPRNPDEMSPNEPVSIRGRAGYALSNLGWQAEPALPILLTALADHDVAAHPGILAALSCIGPSAAAATPQLISLLKGAAQLRKSDELCHAAIQALQGIGAPASEASHALVDVVLSGDNNRSSFAMRALASVGNLSVADAQRLLAAGEAQKSRGDRLFALLAAPGGAGLETLLTRWVTADARLREELQRGLAGIQLTTPPERNPALLALIHHQNPDVRRTVLSCLSRCRFRPDWLLDELAALPDLGTSNDVSTWLIALAAEPRYSAGHVPELIARTNDADTAYWAGRAICTAAPLSPAQIAVLRPLLDDPAPVKHLAAACALAQVLTDEEQRTAMVHALAALEDRQWLMLAAETLLRLHPDPQAAAVIQPMFARGDFPVRLTLLPALVRHLPAADGTDLLMTLLDDSTNLSGLACELLAKRGPDGRRALARLRSHAWAPEGQLSQESWCAIAALDPDDYEAIGYVAAQTWRGHHDRRLFAIAALTTHPAAVPALQRLGELLSDDPDKDIAAAGTALAHRHR